MISAEFVTTEALRQVKKPSRIHVIKQDTLLEALISPRAQRYFEAEAGDPSTHASVQIAFDQDDHNVQSQIFQDGVSTLSVKLRDRSYDGTPEASNPEYGGTNVNIPLSDWAYHRPDYDTVLDGRIAAELSIFSAHPHHNIAHRLAAEGLPSEEANTLARFIENPFEAIPFEQPTPQALDAWWKNWWKVTKMAVAGPIQPFPGQISLRGFEGYLSHLLDTLNPELQAAGFTHVSAIPTWVHVYHMFRHRGFTHDHPDVASDMDDFLQRLRGISVPSLNERRQTATLGELPDIHPLSSWVGVASFAMQLNSTHIPSQEIPETEKAIFEQVWKSIRANLSDESGSIKTYPFTPDRSLWLSKEI